MAIVSHRYRFVFLKSRKTAGSSIEIALGQLCGPDDVLCPTRDGPEFGVVEQNNRKAPGERSLYDYGLLAQEAARQLVKTKKLPLKRIRKQAFRVLPQSHTTARQAIRALPAEQWDSYFTFCFERNPFDRLVSFYHWRTKNLEDKPAFKEFALAAISSEKLRQRRYNATQFSNRPFYEVNSRVVLNRVCRFEDIEQELRTIAEELDLPWNGGLPQAKGTYRKERSYREYYDNDLRRRCEQAFELELTRFNYHF